MIEGPLTCSFDDTVRGGIPSATPVSVEKEAAMPSTGWRDLEHIGRGARGPAHFIAHRTEEDALAVCCGFKEGV
jgi:hypothetical protein